MVEIHRVNGKMDNLTKENYSIPISVFTVNNTVSDYFYGKEVSQVLLSDKAVVSKITSERHMLEVGDEIILISALGNKEKLEVGLIVPDEDINWTEILISRNIGNDFGIFRVKKITIWAKRLDERIFIELYKNILNYLDDLSDIWQVGRALLLVCFWATFWSLFGLW